MGLLTLPRVYPPQEDTALLERALRGEGTLTGAHVLDVGTGSGALALAAARRGAERVVAVDIAWAAVLTARLNAALSRRRVRVLRGDLLAPVEGQRFDLIVANPPYVPSLGEKVPTRGRGRAWEGGRRGRELVDRLCAGVMPLMRPGGVLLVVHSELCGTEMTLERLRQAGLASEVAERHRVPFGPVLRSRGGWLRAQGLAGPDQETDELVVIRGRRPA
ncbi:HemK2/MTQ2 family protein methyltransferase [Streptomyces palmae]|uniref:Methyltransferase domain-containing protein n=1 Tax=Streptomyces palmae TaxID=1701085 RepID=A0A4Z0HFY5_9ACTN|nr:HemK2/MTQ2 family protein methyltransferase [Streptomyces palmae]TGB17695.1 methyltransferase domain-containing protein [Streptomyces palmae]